MRRAVVVGSGLAGTAAAFAARRGGADVTMVLGRPGASALGSGALDDRWDAGEEAAPIAPTADEQAFFDALGLFRVGPRRALVATLSGRLRFAGGCDRAVLDLASLADATVAVPRADRADWDADSIARALSDDPLAAARRLRFEPIDADALRHTDEARLPERELAARHDAARIAWLAERLRGALAGKAAVLLGPWLALDGTVSAALADALGAPSGESLSPVGGLAGVRFERARDRLLSSIGVTRQPGRAVRVRGDGARPLVELDGASVLEADVVVLAIGGVAGGGIELAPSAFAGLPTAGGARTTFFVPSLESPASVASRGRPLDVPSSPFGPEVDALAWSRAHGVSELETAGVWTDAEGRARRRGGEVVRWLVVAGDAVADGPRTAFAAIRTGLAVGARAAVG